MIGLSPVLLEKEKVIYIIQDSREQRPLIFLHPYIEGIKVEKLDYGDYMVEFTDGHRPPYTFERKGSLADIYGSLSKGYKRLKKRMNQAIQDKVTFIIIIEASLNKVNKGYRYSTRKPSEIIQQLFTLMVRHNILFVCCKDRDEMSLFITQFFLAVGREHCRKEKILKGKNAD